MRETVNGRQYLTNLESIEMKKIVAVCCVVLLLCLSSFFTVEGLGAMKVRQYFGQTVITAGTVRELYRHGFCLLKKKALFYQVCLL